ncbi:hypothetical protein IWX47DRAFT_572501 [Phyllosticta citricarpa]
MGLECFQSAVHCSPNFCCLCHDLSPSLGRRTHREARRRYKSGGSSLSPPAKSINSMEAVNMYLRPCRGQKNKQIYIRTPNKESIDVCNNDNPIPTTKASMREITMNCPLSPYSSRLFFLSLPSLSQKFSSRRHASLFLFSVLSRPVPYRPAALFYPPTYCSARGADKKREKAKERAQEAEKTSRPNKEKREAACLSQYSQRGAA